MINKNLLIILIFILILDYIWIIKIQKNNWDNQILLIQNSKPEYNITSAILTYIIMSICILELSINRVDKNNILNDSVKYGFLLGLAMYGIFNGTNFSIFKNYKLKTAIYDTMWGIFLCIIITFLISKHIHNT